MSQLTMSEPSHGGAPIVDLSRAPLPTRATLRRRRNIPLQFLRFVAFDLRIMRMVIKGHH